MASEYLNNRDFQGIISRFQKSKKDKARYELIIEDLEEAVQRISKRKPLSWADDQLSINQNAYGTACKEYLESQDQLAVAFYTLAQNIVRYARFSNIDDDDAVQEGVSICFEKIDRFDPNFIGKTGKKAKAFNYMTTCILNHFRQLYRTARNYEELKRKYHNFLQFRMSKSFIKNGREITIHGGIY